MTFHFGREDYEITNEQHEFITHGKLDDAYQLAKERNEPVLMCNGIDEIIVTPDGGFGDYDGSLIWPKPCICSGCGRACPPRQNYCGHSACLPNTY